MEWLAIIFVGIWLWMIVDNRKKKQQQAPLRRSDVYPTHQADSTSHGHSNTTDTPLPQPTPKPAELDVFRAVPDATCTGIASQWRQCIQAQRFFLMIAKRKGCATLDYCLDQNHYLEPAGKATDYVRQFIQDGLLVEASIASLLPQHYKVDDLKAELHALGQSTGGRHADLAKRLVDMAPDRAREMVTGKSGYCLTEAGRNLVPEIEKDQEQWRVDLGRRRMQKHREVKQFYWARDLRNYRGIASCVGIKVLPGRADDCTQCTKFVGSYRLDVLSEASPPGCSGQDDFCTLYWVSIFSDEAAGVRWKKAWADTSTRH